jgi:rhamnosyltransferase
MLATFNGERYLDEQIQSIRTQSQPNITIYYNDDCSTDRTVELINQYNDIVSVSSGTKYGIGALNFYSLITKVPDSYDFYAFSDQDDIWLPSKLSKGISLLATSNYDLYSSNLISYDFENKINIIKRNSNQTKIDYLYQSLSAGCTYILTKKLFLEVKKIVNKIGVENLMLSHDWLIYALARNLKMNCYVDEVSNIIYRQHKNNETGANQVNLKTINRLFRRFILGQYKNERKLLYKILGLKEESVNIWKIFQLRRDKISSLIIFILVKLGF